MFIKNLFRNVFAASFVMLFLLLNFSCNQVKSPVKIPKEGGGFISTDASKQLINNFQKKYRASKYPFVSVLDQQSIRQFLKERTAPNIRIYYGEEPGTKMINLIVVAADDQGKDIISKSCLLITQRGAKLINVPLAATYTHQFQKDYSNSKEFPYAEKFNLKYINDDLLRRPGIATLQIHLGYSADSTASNLSRVRQIIFAVNAQGEIIYNSPRTGKIKSAAPTYRMASYAADDNAGVENGQQCLSMCNIDSSPLYQTQ